MGWRSSGRAMGALFVAGASGCAAASAPRTEVERSVPAAMATTATPREPRGSAPSPDRPAFPAGTEEVHAWPGDVRLGLTPDGVLATRPGEREVEELRVDRAQRARSTWLDLDGDEIAELVVWGDADPEVVGLRDGRAVVLRRLGQLLAGSHDEASFRARLPFLRGYVGPSAGASGRDVVLTVQRATDEEIRALVDPRGLTICATATGNARPHARHCRSLAVTALTADVIYTEVLAERAFAEYAGQPFALRGRSDGSWVPEAPRCVSDARGMTCRANMGGPGDYVWRFSGHDRLLHLRELDIVIYESS